MEERRDAKAARVVTHQQALDAARQAFMRHGALDMARLADSLAVSRATLYRIVGNRDRLLGDILWSLTEETMSRAVRDARATGIDRIIEIASRFKVEVAGFEPLRRFLRTDPDIAFRVIFTPAGGVHERIVRAWSTIFAEAARFGELVLPLEPDDLAYLFVRIGESILYSDMLIGRAPDLELASHIQRLLLRG